MNPRLTVAALTIIGCLFASAQDNADQPDPVLEAIFKLSNQETPQPPDKAATPPKAVLVTGVPPAELMEPAIEQPAETPSTPIIVQPEQKPEGGIAVRVEEMHTGQGVINPSEVKLRAPFPAKPMAPAPAGWRLDASDSAPPFSREIEISAGTKITLSIRPHLLVPDSDGSEVFDVPDPGYDNTLGYQQTATVGAILSNSIRQHEDESKQLGGAIDKLQQLLISLPNAATSPAISEPVIPIKP